MARGQALQFGGEAGADLPGIAQQVLVFDHVEHRHADGGGHWRAAEGVEVEVGPAECLDPLAAGHQPSEGETVAHGFAEGDDVRHGAVGLVAPHLCTGAGEAGLDFVDDQQAAGLVDQLGDPLDVAGGQPWNALVGEQGVDQHGGQLGALGLQRGDRLGHLGHVLVGQLFRAGARG
ncbi:hypothetical protein D3C84_462960 [compost metagenome]